MIYYYKGFWNCESMCDLDIIGNVAIATERPDNPGTSITNCCEMLATQVCRDFNIPFHNLIWIERYIVNGKETCDMVEFSVDNDGLSNPRWKRINDIKIEYVGSRDEPIKE